MTKGMVTKVGAVALLSLALGSFGCGSNNPSTNTEPVGGSTTPATSAAAGGSTTITTTPASSAPEGGSTTVATSSPPATGGSTTAAGGSTAAPTGGSTSASTTPSTGTGTFSPLCQGLVTAGNAVPSKGVTCTDADPQLCYKTCGPNSMGFKTETCSAGAYVEGKECSFPAGDYSCYKVPAVISATCPATIPQASQPCTVAECTPCNLDGNYNDTSGSSKAGYCVCPKPKTEGGTSKWTCASKDAWPCPSGQGCS
jgi:hypothetical protein